jgi:hypothetical protein
MRYIKVFEDFSEKSNKITKKNNLDDSLITKDDIRKCIQSGGVIYATIIKEFADNDPKKALRPVSIDDDGLVTVEYDNDEYEVSLKNINSIEY